jgi:CheY-like chemotaxis protein
MAKQKILIIDDDLDIIETTGALLEYEGFEIHSAETVESGIEMIEKVSPDLVLLDIMFPEKKTRGFEAATEIKEKYPDLPIFALTAINREYAFDFAKEDIKAEEFINKPVETDKLIRLIKQYVGE